MAEQSKNKKKKKIGFNEEESKEKELNEEEKLLKLLRFSPMRFRHQVQRYMEPHKQLIYDIASKNDDNSSNVKQKLNETQFIKAFDGKIGKELCKAIFEMIYEGLDTESDSKSNDEKCVSQFDIIQFMAGKKVAKHVRNVTVKDADWVLNHLQHVQFKDLDNDSDGKIVIEDFYKHFEPLGVSKARILLMFQMLDKNDDKKISIFEYEGWRQKQTASDLQTVLNVEFICFFKVFYPNVRLYIYSN